MVIVTSLLTISRKSYAKVTSYSVEILEKTEGCSNESTKTPFRKSRETWCCYKTIYENEKFQYK